MTRVRVLTLLAVAAVLAVVLATPARASASVTEVEGLAPVGQTVTARASIERVKARILHPRQAAQEELIERRAADGEPMHMLFLESHADSEAEAVATYCNPRDGQVNTLEWIEDDDPQVQAMARYITDQDVAPAAQGVVNVNINGRRARSVSPPAANHRGLRPWQGVAAVGGPPLVRTRAFVDVASSTKLMAYPNPPVNNLLGAAGRGAPPIGHFDIGTFRYSFDATAGNHNRISQVSGLVKTGGKTNPATAATEYCDALLQPVTGGVAYVDTDVIRNRAKWETGHMIAASLGGSNTEPINFYPQHTVSNHQGAQWGDAEMLALALKTLCPGQSAGMRVTVTVLFDYPVPGAAPAAGVPSLPGVNTRIPSGGRYRISVPTGAANSCGNKLHTWCSPPAPGAPAAGLGNGAADACTQPIPSPAHLNTLPPGVRLGVRNRWPLLRAFYRNAIVANGVATWETPFTNGAGDRRGGVTVNVAFDP